MDESRRTFIKLASLLSLPDFVTAAPTTSSQVTPFPLEAVRLHPSPYLTAVESNGIYLLRLEPDRLLHNFRVSAGLKPKGEIYGGLGIGLLGGPPPGPPPWALPFLVPPNRGRRGWQRGAP